MALIILVGKVVKLKSVQAELFVVGAIESDLDDVAFPVKPFNTVCRLGWDNERNGVVMDREALQ